MVHSEPYLGTGCKNSVKYNQRANMIISDSTTRRSLYALDSDTLPKSGWVMIATPVVIITAVVLGWDRCF